MRAVRQFSSRTLRCPPCRTEFVVEIPRGGPPIRMETDFRPVFEGADLIAADLHACPSCRYAGYADAFERDPTTESEVELERPGVPAPVGRGMVPDDADLEALRNWIGSGELGAEVEVAGEEPTGSERYLLALYCQEFLGHSGPLVLGDLALRGAWCARAEGNQEQEQRLLVEAEGFFSEAYESQEVEESEEGQLLYLSAELARRTGDFGRAVELFNRAESLLDAEDEDGQPLLRLCRRQRALATGRSTMNALIPDDLEDGDET